MSLRIDTAPRVPLHYLCMPDGEHNATEISQKSQCLLYSNSILQKDVIQQTAVAYASTGYPQAQVPGKATLLETSMVILFALWHRLLDLTNVPNSKKAPRFRPQQL